jgi:hypothetical protein
MIFAFDLISDLHIESWSSFDWTGRPTSPFCIVAGDVARDRAVLRDTLDHLGQCYQAVFYIDGNDEHRYHLNDIAGSYQQLEAQIQDIENVVFLHNNVVIVNGVAIVATNAWWTWDYDPSFEVDHCYHCFCQFTDCDQHVPEVITGLARADAEYLKLGIQKLQRHQDVRSIVLVTHTVPYHHMVEHDLDLNGSWKINGQGNSLIDQALDADLENKVTHWCFGHYHGRVDQTINGIRYVNNPRGRGDTQWRNMAFEPLRVEISI